MESERLQYYKIWDEMRENGDGNYALHSAFPGNQVLPTLPDSTMALCIGLVVGYMIYIIVSLMFQSNLSENEEEENQVNARITLISENKFQEKPIPDIIKNLYGPAAEEEKVPLLNATDDDDDDGCILASNHGNQDREAHRDHLLDANVGIHAAFKTCGNHIQNL